MKRPRGQDNAAAGRTDGGGQIGILLGIERRAAGNTETLRGVNNFSPGNAGFRGFWLLRGRMGDVGILSRLVALSCDFFCCGVDDRFMEPVNLVDIVCCRYYLVTVYVDFYPCNCNTLCNGFVEINSRLI